MSDAIIAKIRTLVPVAVGFVLTALAQNLGIVIDEASANSLIAGFQALITAIYYVVVQIASSKFPAFGWLLGYPQQPKYL